MLDHHAEEPQLLPTPDLDVNLRQLFVFMAVVDAGSVTAAAEALFRASSAVARAVTKLESELGVRLFDRRARGMLVNAYGRTVLARARRIASELATGAEAVTASAMRADRGPHSVFSAIPNGRRLAIITRLADHHNMSAVARELAVTQPAISAALKEVEDRLGVPLFTRSAKGLMPTQAGELLAFYFRRALSELMHIGPDLAAMNQVIRGTVRIGALPLGRTRILPDSIASVLAQHPHMRIVTVESPYEALAAQLRSADIDFVFGALRPAPETRDLHQEALFDDCVSIVARAGHPLASRAALTLSDLQSSRWVLSRVDSPAREMLLQCFARAGQPAPQGSVETGDLAILRGVMLRSDMLTAISAQQLHHEIASGELVVLPIDLPETRRSIGIAQRDRALPSPGARVLMHDIRTRVQRMVDGGELLALGIRQAR